MENNNIRSIEQIANLDNYFDNFVDFTSSIKRKMKSTYGLV